MNGAEHYAEAERWLALVEAEIADNDYDAAGLVAAQVHATLALAWASNRAAFEPPPGPLPPWPGLRATAT